MASVKTFLDNYQLFGCKVRLITAQTLLNSWKEGNDVQKKVFMLRITDELMASTEDLTMWLAVLRDRQSLPDKYENEWEYMLDCRVNDSKVSNTLKSLSKIKSAGQFLKEYNLPPENKLIQYLKTDKKTLHSSIDQVISATQGSLHNRNVNRSVMVRFHNKVKHGMMVQDYGNEMYIRDMKFEADDKSKPTKKSNRNLYLDINLNKAKKMVGTIEANMYAIKMIIVLIISDYTYRLDEPKSVEGDNFRSDWLDLLRSPEFALETRQRL